MKYCSKCENKKDRSEFDTHRKSKDGLQGWCKDCHRQYRRSNIGKEVSRKAEGKYQKTSKGKETIQKQRQTDKGKECSRRYRTQYPEKTKARSILNKEIAAGRILRPSHCESCFEERFVEGHHEDYSKPLDVEWLCTKCHKYLHRKVLVCQ